MATQLPTLTFNGKIYVVDGRLMQFRYLHPGALPEYIDFDSDEGDEMIKAWIAQETAAGRDWRRGMRSERW